MATISDSKPRAYIKIDSDITVDRSVVFPTRAARVGLEGPALRAVPVGAGAGHSHWVTWS